MVAARLLWTMLLVLGVGGFIQPAEFGDEHGRDLVGYPAVTLAEQADEIRHGASLADPPSGRVQDELGHGGEVGQVE
jgi:hypothetical protein